MNAGNKEERDDWSWWWWWEFRNSINKIKVKKKEKKKEQHDISTDKRRLIKAKLETVTAESEWE